MSLRPYNKNGAGNGAVVLGFHVVHLRRAVPDLIRSAAFVARAVVGHLLQ